MSRFGRDITGVINGIFASVSYGTNPLFALPLYSMGVKTDSVLFYRYAFAVIIYGIWLKCFKKISLNISIKELFPIIVLGILFSLSSLTLFESFRYIDVGVACTILFIYPIIVAILMAIFFKEKLTKTVLSAIGLTSIGIMLLYNGKPDSSLNFYGVMIVLVSALMYALYIVGVNNIKVIKRVNRAKMSFYVILSGMFVYVYNLKFCTELQILDRPFAWLLVVCLALFPTIISIETINIAIKFIGSTKTAILGALEPLTAIFFGVLLFHEQLTFRIICGVLLILFGVLLIITRKTQRG